MSLVDENLGVTVHCPECQAPMHLPNRDLLGCKARCWQCQEKVILQETPLPEPEPAVEDEESQCELNEGDAEAIPEDFWDQEEATPPSPEAATQPEAKDQGEKESMMISAASVMLPANRSVSVEDPPSAPTIVTCGYCRTRIPLIENLLETDGCPCCGTRVGKVQFRHVETQPDWSIQNGNVVLAEEVHGPFGTIYHGQKTASEEAISVRQVPRDCWVHREGKNLLGGLWQMRNFKHPHAVAYDEISVHQSEVYLIGPPIQGISLADQLARAITSPAQIIKWGLQLSECLEAAHRQGVLHRDVKPANVLITPEGNAKLMSFGLPRRKTGGGYLKGPDGWVVGTVAYLAPEQAQGNGPCDPRSDIYSLGVMLFQMLTGQLPFQGSLPQVLQKITKGTLPAPSKTRPELSWEWDVLCRRCTAKKRTDRYQSAGELHDALQNIASTMSRR